ncbi:hypothetical protein V1477_019090 [Vespula maculifrons]|uniref:Uncharacterized protein n=1 Tax=Vespula maculifrons TaxID=7453 RepID=A0ABD2ARJ4_VESMC
MDEVWVEKTFSAGPCQDPRHAYIYSELSRKHPLRVQVRNRYRSEKISRPRNAINYIETISESWDCLTALATQGKHCRTSWHR